MKKLLSSLSLLSLISLFLPSLALAQTDTSTQSNAAITELGKVAGTGYNTSVRLAPLIGTVIRTALSLLGAIFIIVLIVAGFRWMTASGNEDKVTKAQNAIKRGLIGLVIVVAAWAIWTFLLTKLIIGV